MADTSNVDRSSVTLNVSERPARFSNDPVSDSFPNGINRSSNTRYIDDEAFRASRSSDFKYSEEAATARFSHNQILDDQQSPRFSNNQILDQRQWPRFSDTQVANESQSRLVQSPNTSNEPAQSWAQVDYPVKQPDVLEPILSALKDVCDAAGEAVPRTKQAILQVDRSGLMTSRRAELVYSIVNSCNSIRTYTRGADEFISTISDPKVENRMANVDELWLRSQRLLQTCLALFNNVIASQDLGVSIIPILRPLYKAVKHAAKTMEQSRWICSADGQTPSPYAASDTHALIPSPESSELFAKIKPWKEAID
jgi:hypothetical protein